MKQQNRIASQANKTPAELSEMSQVLLWSTDELMERKIIFPGMLQREVLNAFREVRTKILMKSEKKNLVVLVSSVGSKGGASFTAVNIAASFAMDEGKTALYIDCNLENSFADSLLPCEAKLGLTDYLASSNVSLENVIYATGLPRLRVIPSGSSKERAVEYFSSSRMKQFVDDVRNRYDDRFVVIDCPPVSSSIEARVLAQYCDASVLVVPSAQVTTNQILSGVDALGSKNFAGLVFNN